jgi:hypothetical protein
VPNPAEKITTISTQQSRGFDRWQTEGRNGFIDRDRRIEGRSLFAKEGHPMPRQHRLLVEPLEGRLLMSSTRAQASARAESIDFPEVANKPTIVSQQVVAATVILERTQVGSKKLNDSLQVQVATVMPSTPMTSVPQATPGVQYLPILQTVTFPPGVRSVPVTIPIVAGAANPGMLSIELAASETGSASGNPATAFKEVYLAENINSPVPRISAAQLVIKGGKTTDLLLQFSVPMDPSSVQNANAYVVSDVTPRGTNLLDPLANLIFGDQTKAKPVAITSAIYDATANTVDLHLKTTRSSSTRFQIESTLAAPALRSATGTQINDDGTGDGGGFLITVGNKKVTIQP